MTKSIIEALQTLDPENDAVWTRDGLPQLDDVKAQVGHFVSRASITAEAPDFTRETHRAALKAQKEQAEAGADKVSPEAAAAVAEKVADANQAELNKDGGQTTDPAAPRPANGEPGGTSHDELAPGQRFGEDVDGKSNSPEATADEDAAEQAGVDHTNDPDALAARDGVEASELTGTGYAAAPSPTDTIRTEVTPVRADGGEGVQPVDNPGPHVPPVTADGLNTELAREPEKFVASAGLRQVDLDPPVSVDPPPADVLRQLDEDPEEEFTTEQHKARLDELNEEINDLLGEQERLRVRITEKQAERDSLVVAIEPPKTQHNDAVQDYFKAADARAQERADAAALARLALAGGVGGSGSALDFALASRPRDGAQIGQSLADLKPDQTTK